MSADPRELADRLARSLELYTAHGEPEGIADEYQLTASDVRAIIAALRRQPTDPEIAKYLKDADRVVAALNEELRLSRDALKIERRGNEYLSSRVEKLEWELASEERLREHRRATAVKETIKDMRVVGHHGASHENVHAWADRLENAMMVPEESK